MGEKRLAVYQHLVPSYTDNHLHETSGTTSHYHWFSRERFPPQSGDLERRPFVPTSTRELGMLDFSPLVWDRISLSLEKTNQVDPELILTPW